MYNKPLFLQAGDQALVIELGDSINPKVNRKIRSLTLAIEEASIPGVLDLVPTYRSLLVYYDPMAISAPDLQTELERLVHSLSERELDNPRNVYIPTLYGGKYGPDLEFVAQYVGLSSDEVISLHSGTYYLVYMMGFSPGFPYLGGLPEQLTIPRLETPRTEVPAGSVGIAESQTGVYPVASPAGWRLIGRTPIIMFDPKNDPPSLLSPGDHVHYVPIATEQEYLDIRQRAESGRYEVATEAVQ